MGEDNPPLLFSLQGRIEAQGPGALAKADAYRAGSPPPGVCPCSRRWASLQSHGPCSGRGWCPPRVPAPVAEPRVPRAPPAQAEAAGRSGRCCTLSPAGGAGAPRFRGRDSPVLFWVLRRGSAQSGADPCPCPAHSGHVPTGPASRCPGPGLSASERKEPPLHRPRLSPLFCPLCSELDLPCAGP